MPLVPDVTGRRQGHPHSWLLTGDHSWRSSGSTLLFLIPQSKLASKWQWSTGTRAELKARASQVPSQLPEGLQSAEAFVMAELIRRGMPPLDVAQPLDVPAATHACVEPMTPGPVAPEPMTPGHGPLTPLSASKAQPRSLLQRAADGAKAFGAKISLSPLRKCSLRLLVGTAAVARAMVVKGSHQRHRRRGVRPSAARQTASLPVPNTSRPPLSTFSRRSARR